MEATEDNLTLEEKINYIYQWVKRNEQQAQDYYDILLRKAINDPWIDEKMAARFLGVSPRTLREKIVAGREERIDYTTVFKKYHYRIDDIIGYKNRWTSKAGIRRFVNYIPPKKDGK